MNKKLNPNFSLKKLLLSALVAGPLAILPAPLWALPSTAATNLTTSSTSITYSGVTLGGTGTQNAPIALNITAPDKSILTWQAFGIGQNETINYLLPSTTASVLNNVAGGALSTIAGAINSNGNVYVLNPAGIVISQTAQIITGGFYASTVAEPSSFFTTTGTLNFTGSATTDVVVQSDGEVTAGQIASIQALGTGNKITLAGRSVLVEGANLFGNVTLQSAATGKVNLAQTSDTVGRPQAGGAVNISQAAGSGGNLTIVSNGGTVSLTGAPLAVSNGAVVGIAGPPAIVEVVVNGSSTPVAGPVFTVNATGGLAITPATGLGGSGYTPSTTLALTITSPQIRQNNNTAASTNTVVVGTTAAGFATTNTQGQITGYTLTTPGTGYITTTAFGNTTTVNGTTLKMAVEQAGFATNVAGTLSLNSTGSTANGAVTQTNGLLTVTGASTITTGTTATTAAAANVTLSNSALSTLNLPLVGTVTVTEADGVVLGNAKVLPNATTAFTVTASAGNISMSSGAKVEIVPSVAVSTPEVKLTASKGGITFSNTGDLKLSTLSTTTTSSGTASLTSTGNITVPAFGGTGLTVTTTGGTINTGNISHTAVAATLTATGNVTLGGDVSTSGKIIVTSGGTIALGQAVNGFMTTGAGLDLKAVGDITMTSQAALVTTGTDAKIASSAGSVTLTGGFAGGGAITAANNITIGAPGTGKATGETGLGFDGTSLLWKVISGTTKVLGGLYTPNSTIPVTVAGNGTGPNTPAAASFTTNASGQISGVVITEAGIGYGPRQGVAPTVTLTATNAPTNSVVANSALTLTATAGTVAVASPIVGTGTVSIVSGGALSVPSITAPTVSLESTTASVGQNPGSPIIASGTTTLKAATSVSLDLAANDFNNVVLTSSASGVTLKDANALTLANGTNAAGNVTITSGAGLTGFTAGAITVAAPNVASTVGSTTISGGSVTGVTLTTVGTGYVANATVPATLPVTFTAPPTSSTTALVIANSVAAGTAASTQGLRIGAVGTTTDALQAVVIPSPIGNGFAAGEVALTVTMAGGFAGVAPTVVGIANGNGQIASVRVLTPGSGITAGTITSINPTSNAPITNVTATGYLTTDAVGKVTGLVVTDGGSGYLGNFVPRVTLPAAPAAGNIATIMPTTPPGAPVTELTYSATASGSGFITAPVIAATASAPAFTTTIVNGAIATVTPIATGGVSLGSASTDVIKVAGNLTLSSVGPVGSASNGTVTVKHSELTTVAANVAVVGNVSLNTLGANATFGVPTGGFGAAPAVTAAAVGGAIGTGTFTVTQNNSVNLGATTAGVLKAKSAAGEITNSGKLAITGASEFIAGSLFAPAVITLNDATNVFGGTVSIINGKNVSVVGATAVTVGSVAQNGVVSGSISVESAGALNLGVAGNGNLSVVSFKAGANGANVIIDDGANLDGLTLQNISNTAGTVDVTASGPITLGSGIKLAGGVTTITSNGAAASIKDSAPGISIINGLTLRSANDIAITNTGHSVGRVTMTSGTGIIGTASTNANITYQEGGSANLGAVTITAGATTPGSLSVTSTGGSIFQGVGTITVPAQTTTSTNTATFTALAGEVTLDRVGNSLAAPVSISAAGNSTVRQSTGNLVLGNVAVTAGTFAALVHAPVVIGAAAVTGAGVAYTSVPTVTVGGGGTGAAATATLSGGTTGTVTAVAITAAGSGYSTPTLSFSTSGSTTAAVATTLGTVASELQQATGTTVRVFGDTTLSSVGKITLDNVGNNFGGLTIASNLGGSALATAPGAAVVLREGGTINLKAVDTGTGGATFTSTLKLTSDGGSIVSSATALQAKFIKVGGPTTLVSAADVTLNTTDVANSFSGQSITVTAPGNVSIQDNSATTVIAGGSTIGGTLTIKNDNAAGTIKDSPGALTVNGNVFLQTSATGSINIGASTAKLGAVQFRSGGVSIAEATTLNLAAGSTSAAGSVVQLSSNGDIVTSGLGGGSFGGTLSLNANGSITVSNPIFVAQGLTFRALGAVNLSALSQTGNLSGLAPTNLGAASYVAPSP